MKLLSQIKFYQSILLIITGAAALLTASCTGLSPKQEPLNEAAACTRLQSLIADHPNKFKQHKKNKRTVRNMNTWTAIAPFPSAHNCQIWEWSTGLNSYICNWKSDDGMPGAQAGYQEGEGIIQRCLGKQWTAHSNKTTSGGEHTYFNKPGSNTYVSIRYFKESRSFTENWHTVLYIGDKSNLKAQTQ